MDFIDGLMRVPTFVPPRWFVAKNMLFDLAKFSAADLDADEREFFELQIRDASMLFAASSSDRIGTKVYDAHCFVGVGGKGYDYDLRIRRSKRLIFEDVGDVDDIHEAAERVSAFMFTWHWFPERLLGGE